MKNLIVGHKETVERLAERLKQASSHAEYQRIQCVLIRATLGSTAAEIALLLGWSTATVHVIHSRWAKEGDAIFDLRARGGRRHRYLSVEQEMALLAQFAARAEPGGMLDVAEIQQLRAADRQTGGTIYGLPIARPARMAEGRSPSATSESQRRGASRVQKNSAERYAARSGAKLSRVAVCG